MKKIVSILLVLVTVLSMGTMAFADGTTTLTTTVPAATYTLNIPADQVINFGATISTIGTLSLDDADGFAEGKDLKVTIAYTDFTSEGLSTKIPFKIVCPYGPEDYYEKVINSGSSVKFISNPYGFVTEFAQVTDVYGETHDLDTFRISIDSADWGKALGGDYTATITFTSEVVVE